VSNDDFDGSFIAAALPAFISEAQEQTEALEQLLLKLEDAPDDRELLDALFRCAHTVKGSAGIFGLDDIVGFTHHVETLLDQLREGRFSLSPALSTLLLKCNDQIRALVDAAQTPQDDGGAAAQVREGLVTQLRAACHSAPAAAAMPVVPASAAQNEPAGTRRWHLSVRFGTDTFRNGMDPLAILNYLRGMGAVPHLTCDAAAVPALDQMDGESCHLGFDLILETDASRAKIEDAFAFVRDDCTLHLTEPGPTPHASTSSGGNSESASAQQAAAAPQAAVEQAAPQESSASALESASPPAKQRAARDGNAPVADETRYIRVQADRLDAVINMLGELVIASAGAALLARQTRQGSLIEANQQIGALVEEIRNGTLQLRMVPVGETFARFRRVVRDTAAELGKDVVLDIVGGETELDKSVVERIADPLMHLVRNSLDHGLETSEQRQASGKPAQGHLTLSACHESGSIIIHITDDGRGIDREKVLQRAWARGLVEPGVTPPDEEILKLIFEPGFSTAEKITNLSGRGVGMDVVRRNIEALRGTVTISSEPGKGSRVELRLPLTLAIIDGFLIGVGPSKFIFPLDTVVEVIETRSTVTALDSQGRSVVELRGRTLPVVDLRALYALDSEPPERSSVVVIRCGTSSFGVVVDQLLGQHQTVIKPMGRMFRSLRGISGSTILGNGDVALIFDVTSLSSLASSHPGPTGAVSARNATALNQRSASTEGLES
jgi:two-component system, chemotaxis family, sensor kinase CheA